MCVVLTCSEYKEEHFWRQTPWRLLEENTVATTARWPLLRRSRFTRGRKWLHLYAVNIKGHGSDSRRIHYLPYRYWSVDDVGVCPWVDYLTCRLRGLHPYTSRGPTHESYSESVSLPLLSSLLSLHLCVPPPSLHPSNTANNTKASNTERSKAYHRRLKLCTTLTTLPPLSAAHRSQNSRVRKENITTNDSSIYLNKYII